MKTARQQFKIGDNVVLVSDTRVSGVVVGFYRDDVYGVKIKRPGYAMSGYGVSEWIRQLPSEKSFSASQPLTANSTPSLSVVTAVSTETQTKQEYDAVTSQAVQLEKAVKAALSIKTSEPRSGAWQKIRNFFRGIVSK